MGVSIWSPLIHLSQMFLNSNLMCNNDEVMGGLVQIARAKWTTCLGYTGRTLRQWSMSTDVWDWDWSEDAHAWLWHYFDGFLVLLLVVHMHWRSPNLLNYLKMHCLINWKTMQLIWHKNTARTLVLGFLLLLICEAVEILGKVTWYFFNACH